MRNQVEHEIQTYCIKLYKMLLPDGIIFAVPNQGKRSPATLNYFIQEGFTAGAPDLILTDIDGNIRFVEMKTKTGKLSEAQKKFKERCDNIQEGLYVVCRSIDDFKSIINNKIN